jgi:polyphosphate kinase 2 (PPK2 family)
VFKHCSEAAPWHIVPADKNWYKHYTLARVTVEALEKLPLAYPAFR